MRLIIKLYVIISFITISINAKKLINDSKNLTFDEDTLIVFKKTNVYDDIFKSKINLIVNANTYHKIYQIEYLKNNIYPWSRIKQGWVNSPYLYIKKSENIKNKKINLKYKSKILTKKNNIKRNKLSYYNFLGMSIGYSRIDINKNNINGNINLSRKVNNYGYNIIFEAGINYKKSFYTLAYENIIYKDFKLENFILSLNKRFNYTLKPYIGMLFGSSYMKLKITHIDDILYKPLGKNIIYGIQTGIEYKLSDKIYLHSSLQYIKNNYNTILNKNGIKAILTRKNNINLNIGFRFYLF